MMKGTLVCNGITFDIKSIDLENGNVVIRSHPHSGPLPACQDGNVAVFGVDGQGVGAATEAVSWARIRRHEVLVLTCTLRIRTWENDPEDPK